MDTWYYFYYCCIIACLGLLALIILKIYLKLKTGRCESNVCLVGKTAIITGGNAGIGYQTAEDFAKRGANVIIACRNEGKGEEAVKRLIEATDNTNVAYKRLDLCSFRSIRKFAADILETEERLDILVNNAGIINDYGEKSEDGLFQIIQTNHLGPFLLTNLLLDLIKRTRGARVVNVASQGAAQALFFDVDDIRSYPKGIPFPHLLYYGHSKLCNILFTIELANRLKGTEATVYSVHPGFVETNMVDRVVPTSINFAATLLSRLFFKDAIEGAQTTIHCAVAKGIEALSGEQFEECLPVKRYWTASDPEQSRKLWKVSEEIVKLNS